MTKIGTIILWKKNYGFVQEDNSLDTYYFHISNFNSEPRNISVLNRISFELKQSNNHKFANSFVATNITFIQNEDIRSVAKNELTNFKLYIGEISNVIRPNLAEITCPILHKKCLLHKKRFIYNRLNFVNKGDIVVFCPVINVNKKQLTDSSFALIAYALPKEKNVEFINEQRRLLIQYGNINLSQRMGNLESISNSYEHLLLKLIESNSFFYKSIKDSINSNKNSFGEPNLETIKKYVNEDWLIQLWIEDIIQSYDSETLKKIFDSADSNFKEEILNRVQSEKEKVELIEFHIQKLDTEKRLDRLNDFITIILNLIKELEIDNERLTNKVIEKLSIADKIDLWSRKYIEFDEKIIKNNLDLNDIDFVVRLIKNRKEFSVGVLEDAIYKLIKNKSNFDSLIIYLHLIKKAVEKKDFIDTIGIVLKTINKEERFLLYLFDIQDEEEDFFHSFEFELNHFYRMIYTLKYHKKFKSLLNIEVTKEGLIEFINTVPWNKIISPTQIDGNEAFYISFHEILNEYIKITNKSSLEHFWGEDIYKTIPNIENKEYKVEHIRLFLYKHVGHYDYIGYKYPFNQLTNKEKKLLKNLLSYHEYEEIIENPYRENVKPCTLVSNENGIKTYNANLNNFYFSKNNLMLRLEDSNYTSKFQYDMVSVGFNQIPESDKLNKIAIYVRVENNIIKDIQGLDEIIQTIIQDKIKKALGTTRNPLGTYKKSFAYTEDYELRKKIISYLESRHDNNYEKLLVNEPHNFQRRLDENSEIDDYQLSKLYVIKSGSEYAIVWENNDFSDDKATYIFKTKDDDINTLQVLIAKEISSISQLRSTLRQIKGANEGHEIYKKKLGFVGVVMRNRGKANSFDLWKKEFYKNLGKPAPQKPSNEDLVSLENWNPNNGISRRLSTKPPPNLNREEATSIDIQDSDENIIDHLDILIKTLNKFK